MKKLMGLILLSSLTGCSQYRQMFGVNAGNTGTAHEQGVVLAMGQSNMQERGGRNGTIASSFQSLNPNVIVINCAQGNTSITQWSAPAYLFKNCLYEASSYPFPIVGILFYQGETDAYNQMTNWDTYFLQNVTDWRNVIRRGEIPIIYAQLATNDGSLNWPASTFNLIKQQQANLHLPNTAMVMTKDQPLMDDEHLGSQGVAVVGQRMSIAFNQLRKD